MTEVIKYGLCEWVLPAKMQGPAACRVARDMGLNGIELELGHASQQFPLANDYTINCYLEERERYQIEFPALACNMTDFFPMTAPRGTAGREMVEYALRLSVKTAKKMNIPIIQIPNFLASAITTEEELRQAAECLQYGCDLAAEEGITIGTENCLPVEWQMRELELVGRPNFKIYFDTQNYQLLAGLYPPDLVAPLYPEIVEVHLKDGIGTGGSRRIGEGENDVAKTIANFIAGDYRGWMIFENEYFKPPLTNLGEDGYQVLKDDLNTVKRLVNQERAN